MSDAPAGQVTQRSISNSAYAYSAPALSQSYSPNGLNQYASVGGTSFGYDGRGNLTSDGSRSFSYDLNNWLTGVSGSASLSLAYDPLGRLQQTSASSTEQYLYDGSDLVVEYDGSGNILRRYVPGPGADQPLVWYEGSGLSTPNWLHTDQQGSIIAASNCSATATTFTYGPSGEPSGGWGSSPATPIFRYTGQAALAAVKLYYYKARMYDPALGRFLQTDPLSYTAGLNLYAYASNDPVNFADPSGMDTCGPGSYFTNDEGEPVENICVTAPPAGGGGSGGAGGGISGSPEQVTVTAVRPPPSGTLGHDYSTDNGVCRRDLTPAERADLLSRYSVPNINDVGNPISPGTHWVTNSWGLPGGEVQTSYQSGGQQVTNTTTWLHVFAGTIVRSAGARDIKTHGTGNAGPGLIGRFRDEENQANGPAIFNFYDSRAAAYAKAHYPGC
jgi:RHS repeat-associated protein